MACITYETTDRLPDGVTAVVAQMDGRVIVFLDQSASAEQIAVALTPLASAWLCMPSTARLLAESA